MARLCQASRVLIRRCPITDPDAALLVERVQEEYVVRYGGRDESPITPEVFDEPRGAFFVGYDAGAPVATGGWRLRSDVRAFDSSTTAEVKRMFVVPEVRGRGLAREMLAHLEQTAAAAGAEVMVLETGTLQPEAIALYESAGYTRIADFGHYRDSPISRCFGRRI
jgi:ribosomal protein S18 acetylase RimI-like enzyme